MAEFKVPTLDELHGLIVIDYEARFPNANVAKLSDNWKRARVLAMAVTSLHAHIVQVFANLFASTAKGIWLDKIGALYNITRKAATVSKGTDVLRVTGTAASAVADGDQLTHSDGTIYEVDEAGVIPASPLYVDVDVVSVTLGSTARKQSGQTLTFSSPPAGINSAAELQGDLSEGGADTELDGPYRQRILDRIAQPNMGGSAEDYRQWALAVSGIVLAFVYSARNGTGTIDIVPTKSGSGAVRIPTAAEITAVQTAIDAERPVSVKDFRVLTPVAQPQDVEITLLKESNDYSFDWDDSTPLVVSTWTLATLTVKFTTARPADMAIGDRIIINTATATGIESTIESLSGADSVVLKKAPAATPVATDVVYAGGSLVEPARVAIKALIDTLGPDRGLTAALPWTGALSLADLFKTVQLLTGVLDSTIVAPVANVTPTDTIPNTTINILTPDKILVRSQ